MKLSIVKAFEHFDRDGSKTLNLDEIVSFLESYCHWIQLYHWELLQKPRLMRMLEVMATTLCGVQKRLDLLSSVTCAFEEIVDMEDFKKASKKDVVRVSEAVLAEKENIAKKLLEKCDKNADGVLDLDEFEACANLDLLQSTAREKGTESEYAKLWRTRSKSLVQKFCALCASESETSASTAEPAQNRSRDSEERHRYEEFRSLRRQHSVGTDVPCTPCGVEMGCAVS
eukprot:g2055.t1